MGALWTRGSVNLFTCAVYHKLETKTLSFGTDYKGKDKFSTGLFVETLYKEHILPNDDIKEEIIWSDGPRSEFKNQYMRYVIEILSHRYKKVFSWKYSATAHGKGVVDGVGGKVKSSVHKKVMSIGKEKIIVQDAESFCKLAKELSKSTTVIYISSDDVEAYKRTDPFADSVPVPGISKMHFILSNENTQLWLNSAHQKSDPPSITICNKSFNQFSLNSVTAPPLKNPLSYHDVVKITKGNFTGFYAIVRETGDLNNLSDHDEVEINYLKPSFGKWVVNTNDLDSRETGDLVHVSATIDGRSRYSITD